MLLYHVVLSCLMWTTASYSAALKKPRHATQGSVKLDPLNGTMNILSNDAISALELHRCAQDAEWDERNELFVQVEVTITTPTKHTFTELIAVDRLQKCLEMKENVVIPGPKAGKTKTALVQLSPGNDFAYQLALIRARQSGLRTIEWEGRKYDSSVCKRALNTLKDEFPLIADYCDQLHTNIFKPLESASPYSSRTQMATHTAIKPTASTAALKKLLLPTEQCLIAMATAQTTAQALAKK